MTIILLVMMNLTNFFGAAYVESPYFYNFEHYSLSLNSFESQAAKDKRIEKVSRRIAEGTYGEKPAMSSRTKGIILVSSVLIFMYFTCKFNKLMEEKIGIEFPEFFVSKIAFWLIFPILGIILMILW